MPPGREPEGPPCPREQRVARVVQKRADALTRHGDPGVRWRAEDARDWAADAAHVAASGMCSLARSYLRPALRYYRRARIKADG